MAIKTLLVDDERSLLEQSKIFLERMDQDLEVITAISPEKACSLLNEKDIEVIVSDYQMPDTNGLEFLEGIREEKSNDIPFIMFTGKGREEVAMKALNLGADRYIQKGGDPRDQYSILAQAIEQEVTHHRTKEKNRQLLRELKKSKMLLDSIFHDPDIYIGILELDGRLLKANESSLELLGLSNEDVRGKYFWETPWWAHTQKDQERLKESIDKASEGEIVRFRATHKGKDDEKVEVDFSIRPVRDEDGEIVRLLAQGKNVQVL